MRRKNGLKLQGRYHAKVLNVLSIRAMLRRSELGHFSSTGVNAMRKQYRFLLLSLVPAFLFGSVSAVVQAQNAGTPAVKQSRWSDSATWPGRKVPVAGDKVTIEKGKDVVLDVSPPAMNGFYLTSTM